MTNSGQISLRHYKDQPNAQDYTNNKQTDIIVPRGLVPKFSINIKKRNNWKNWRESYEKLIDYLFMKEWMRVTI